MTTPITGMSASAAHKANIRLTSPASGSLTRQLLKLPPTALHKECTVCKLFLKPHRSSQQGQRSYPQLRHRGSMTTPITGAECECGDIGQYCGSQCQRVDRRHGSYRNRPDGASKGMHRLQEGSLKTAPILATGSTIPTATALRKYDGTNHWHECECGDKSDTAAHSFPVGDRQGRYQGGHRHHTRNAPFAALKRSENTVIDKLPTAAIPAIQAAVIITPISQEATTPPKSLLRPVDSSDLIGWLAALFVGGGVLTLLGVSSKKRKDSEAE